MTKDQIDVLIECMDLAGLYYDDLASTDDNIRFTHNMGVFAWYFKSWCEVKEYLDLVVIDDPVLSDLIEFKLKETFKKDGVNND